MKSTLRLSGFIFRIVGMASVAALTTLGQTPTTPGDSHLVATNAGSYDELKERVAANAGFSYIFWDGDPATEEKIKQETKATIRCIPLYNNDDEGPDIFSGKIVHGRALVEIGRESR